MTQIEQAMSLEQEALDSSNRNMVDQAIRNGTPEKVGGRIVFNKMGQMVAEVPRIVESIKDRPYSQVREGILRQPSPNLTPHIPQSRAPKYAAFARAVTDKVGSENGERVIARAIDEGVDIGHTPDEVLACADSECRRAFGSDTKYVNNPTATTQLADML